MALGLRESTRSSIVMSEAGLSPIWILTGHRAMRYEERSRDSPCETLKACMKERAKAEDAWATERRDFCARGGLESGGGE